MSYNPDGFPSIAISWQRLPPYAARSIRTALESTGGQIKILGSQPLSLTSEVESIIQEPIVWLDSDKPVSWQDLGLDVPNIFFQSGWRSKAFRCLGEEVNRFGGRVICFADNIWSNTPKQWLGFLIFKYYLKHKFYGIWVPGEAGRRLFRFYGMPDNRIYKNLYTADSSVFYPGQPLSKRKKQFVFVGQLIERKGISLLLQAFSKFHKQNPDWTLLILGSGPLKISLNIPGVLVNSFQPPAYIASALRESRFLILPSLEEHWGLVVHEAALSGCGLILSGSVGSAPDLLSSENGLIFKTGSISALYSCLLEASSWDDEKLCHVSLVSQAHAAEFSVERWASQFHNIIQNIRQDSPQIYSSIL